MKGTKDNNELAKLIVSAEEIMADCEYDQEMKEIMTAMTLEDLKSDFLGTIASFTCFAEDEDNIKNKKLAITVDKIEKLAFA